MILIVSFLKNVGKLKSSSIVVLLNIGFQNPNKIRNSQGN